VPGLRRAEVAQLAGVSIEYYTRLERGNLSGASEAVLDSLVAALQLDESERAYLFDLAKAASAPNTPRRQRKTTAQEVRPSIQRLLDAMIGIPAFVRNGRLDILGINAMGRALYSQAFETPTFDSPGRTVKPASSSSTRGRTCCTPTGRTRPTPACRYCARRLAGIPTTKA
jgi:transcriptional regulator with XRE-family HTH domain